jgi:hypothetical protein
MFWSNPDEFSNRTIRVTFRDAIAEIPPTSLVAPYYSCVLTWDNSLFNAVGISTGNSSLAVQFFALALLPMIYIVIVVRKLD